MKDNVHIVKLMAVVGTLMLAVMPIKGQLYLNRLSLRFPVPTAEDLNRGYVESHRTLGQSDVSVQTNVSGTTTWKLYITTEQPFFTSFNMSKPHYHLLWKLNNEPDSKYRPISLQKMQITEGKSSKSVNVDFRLKLDWSDPPAEYSTEILFVLETTRDKMKKKVKAKRIEEKFQ